LPGASTSIDGKPVVASGSPPDMSLALSFTHNYFILILLRRARIRRTSFADLNGVEQWRKHANLIGLFALIAPLYGQGADFFWV
jgi:hypothetical protein